MTSWSCLLQLTSQALSPTGQSRLLSSISDGWPQPHLLREVLPTWNGPWWYRSSPWANTHRAHQVLMSKDDAMPDATWLVQQCSPLPSPNNTRPNSMVKGRTMLETKYTLPFTNPDLILRFRRAKAAGIIERSPWVVVRKKDKRSYVEGRDKLGYWDRHTHTTIYKIGN